MTLAVAHRGDPFAAVENTLAAFAAALDAGAGMVEIDVRRCADGEVAVVHDETLERIWGNPRRVGELTLAEVQATAVNGQRIPSFAEVLATVDAPLMVDYEERGVVEPALAAIDAAAAFDRCLFAGENIAGHRRIRELVPEARIALTWCDAAPPPDALLDELGVEFFNPPFELLTSELVAAMHARGTDVSTWTVDDEGEMERVLAAGADAVISNRIGRLVELLDAREAAPC